MTDKNVGFRQSLEADSCISTVSTVKCAIEWTVSKEVVSVRQLRKIATSDINLFHETELFPAALIRKWHPVHIALFHNGKVVLTGLKSVEHFYEAISTLTSFLESSNIYE